MELPKGHPELIEISLALEPQLWSGVASASQYWPLSNWHSVAVTTGTSRVDA